MPEIEIGHEVGSGKPVFIPLGHTIVTGQSQKSGKTTALEAMAARVISSTVIAFVTKRGERSFGDELRNHPKRSFREMDPYFEERGDWRYVASILESQLGEKLKFERAWIMRICKGARSFSDVLESARRLQSEAKKSMDRDMFMMLTSYLEEVVPLIARLPARSRSFVVVPGYINVMNIVEWPAAMQMLFIASVLARVSESQVHTIVVIPESWETLPERRNTPVKESAVQIARKGAAVDNYLYLDCQDIAGVSKEVIRQSSVWLLGVQREANEIKRTLEHLPAGLKKPKAVDVASLQLGQFFVCTPTAVTKTYVRPVWMPRDMAVRIALGRETSADVAKERARLLAERDVTTKSLSSPPSPSPSESSDSIADIKLEISAIRKGFQELSDKIEAITKTLPSHTSFVTPHVDEGHPRPPAPPTSALEHRPITRAPKRSAGGMRAVAEPLPVLEHQPSVRYDTQGWTPMEEELYQKFKKRLVEELRQEAPQLLRVVVTKPELEVVVEREIVEVNGKTVLGRVARMIKQGWFDDYRSAAETARQYNATGAASDRRTVYGALEDLLAQGFFIKNSNGYKAVVDMKINVRDS